MTARRQKGFTLVELMVASAVGLILVAALGGILTDSLRTADAMASQTALNRHARETFDLMAFGGFHPNPGVAATGTLADFKYVFGLRGRRGATAGGTTGWSLPSKLMVKDGDGTTRRYRLALPQTGTEPLGPPDTALLGEEIRDVSVACSDADLPLQGCALNGSVAGVRGFLRAEPQMSPAGAVGGVTEAAVQLIDPRRAGSPRQFLDAQTATFWTAFTALQQWDPY